ncbi:MAG: SDR family oxidoreductase [Nitrospinota bacterium]
MSVTIKGRVALITGASRGLGRATAERFAKEGAKVILTGRGEEALREAAAAVKKLAARENDVLAVPCDVTDEAHVKALFQKAFDALGRVDVLVNNVGYWLMKPLHETTLGEWSQVLNTKTRAAFLCSREALPGMLERGEGHIVNVASGGARNGAANFAAFCASEFGLLGFTQSLAEEVRGRGVHVSCLMPMGSIESPKTVSRITGGDPSTWLDHDGLVDGILLMATQGPRALTTELIVTPPSPNYG